MSKLLDALREAQLNLRKVVPARTCTIVANERVSEALNISYNTVTKYKFNVELFVEGFAQDKEEIGLLRQRARRTIAEEVFGEFRPLIADVEEALWDRDFEEANRRLSVLHSRMFST